MKIGIFGGTFNPPHIGHIEVAVVAYNALALDKIYFVPANIPRFKADPAQNIMPEQRLEQLANFLQENTAILGDINYEVSNIDVQRGGTTYTIDTLHDFRKIHPEDELFFIFGSDILPHLMQWKSVMNITRLAQLICVKRANYDYLELISHISPEIRQRITYIDADVTDVSSSELRFSKTKRYGL